MQLVILALLEKGPSHGYELIKSLEELSDGFYVPSPGMIYPALTYLEEIGFAQFEAEGAKKRYLITTAGLEQLEKNREATQTTLEELAKIGARMAEARKAFAGELKSEQAAPGQNPAELMAAIARRRSMGLSKLKPDLVDRKLIEQMLEAANWAPSNEDTEPWRFTVFSGQGREKLAEIFAQANPEAGDGARKRAFAAPVWISIGMSPKLKEDGSLLMSEDEEIMAVACAVQNLHLMASALGLAGMWHSKGLSVDPIVAKGLGLEPPARLLGFFFCGWPAAEWTTGERGPIAEKVRWIDEI